MMQTSNGIKAILFDLDGTIHYSRPTGIEAFHRFVEDLGYSLSPEVRHRGERWEYSYWAESDELKEDLLRYPRAEGDSGFWKNYLHKQLAAAGLPDEAAQHVETIFRRMRDEHKPEDHVPEEVPHMLASLRQAGYVLGLVSNRLEPLGPVVAALGLAERFDFTLAAGEIGVFKPAPGIFHHAARLASAEPHETVYVGDNYFADVLGATRAGLHAILLDPKKLFPEAECEVIGAVWDVPNVLSRLVRPSS